jgi:hypothetical protein
MTRGEDPEPDDGESTDPDGPYNPAHWEYQDW